MKQFLVVFAFFFLFSCATNSDYRSKVKFAVIPDNTVVSMTINSTNYDLPTKIIIENKTHLITFQRLLTTKTIQYFPTFNDVYIKLDDCTVDISSKESL